MSRIVARHAALAETVRTVADPVALIVASLAITLPRYAMYKSALAQARANAAQQGDELGARRNGRGDRPAQQQPPPTVGVPGTPDGPPIDPSTAKMNPNGRTETNFSMRFMSDGGMGGV